MSSSLLHKSLKLFEEDNKNKKPKKVSKSIQKHGKRRKQVIQLHLEQEEIKKKIVEQNIKKLKVLNSFSVSPDVSKKIFQHAVKGKEPLDLVTKKEEITVFTEEDFAAFERDYVVDN